MTLSARARGQVKANAVIFARQALALDSRYAVVLEYFQNQRN